MKIKKLSAIFSIVIIAALITVYYTSVGFTNTQSNSAKVILLADSTITNPVYSCPMHSDVTSDKPGKCSKCGMDLVLNSDNSGDMNMTMKDCMEKCKDMGCTMENCKGESGGCKEGCCGSKDCKDMMKDCMSKDKMKDGKCKMNCNGK